MRLFVAINLPDETRAAVHDALSPLRDAVPELRWIGAERLHLTVRFLGEQPEELVHALADVVADAARKSASMTLGLATVGAFPGFQRARVVWLGVDYEPKLELLYHDVETACMSLGFEVEGRAFRPHLTLARIPERLPETRARDLQRAARGIRVRTTTTVNSVDLMRSELGAGRSELGAGASRYSVLSRAMLRHS